MSLSRRGLLAIGVAAGVLRFRCAHAQTGNTIRIGVLTDMSGRLRDTTGLGSVAGAKLAANEFIAANPDIAVEILAADADAQAIEAEANAFLAEMKGLRLPDGRERVVRYGHGPARLIQTGIGPVAMRKGRSDPLYLPDPPYS